MNRTCQRRFAFHIVTSLLGFLALGFAGGVLACSTAAWDGGTTGSAIVAGDFPTDGHQVYAETCSLGVTPNNAPNHVQDGSPVAEAVFIARFYVYLQDLNLASGESFTAFEAFNSSDGSELAVDIEDTTGSGDYEVTVTAVGQPPSSGDSIPFLTPAALPGPVQWSAIEVAWDAEAGTVALLVNGEAGSGLSGLTTSGNRIEYIQLGDLTGLNSVGTAYYDAYASRRSGTVGLAMPGDSNMDGFFATGDMIQIQQMINTPVIPFHGPADCNGDILISVGDMICLQNAINAG